MLALGIAASSGVFAESLPTRQEVLSNVYPNALPKAERVFLTRKQMEDASALAKIKIPSALLARYVLYAEGQSVGRAYVDTHVIRTKKESLLICLDPGGKLKRIEVTAFQEPPEYQAPDGWFEQFSGKQLDEDLRLQRSIRPLTGASLTAHSVTAAVRRVLAIDEVLEK
jgi:hypothetical protein